MSRSSKSDSRLLERMRFLRACVSRIASIVSALNSGLLGSIALGAAEDLEALASFALGAADAGLLGETPLISGFLAVFVAMVCFLPRRVTMSRPVETRLPPILP